MGRRSLLLTGALLISACTAAGSGSEADTMAPSSTTLSPRPSTTTTVVAPTTTTTRPDEIPTADEIIADGAVTTLERELARWAVFTCVEEAGADTTFELYDVDPVVSRDYGPELQECRLPYVGLYRENRMPGDQFDLGLLGVVACTEAQTGADYGPKTIDEIGRLTPESHRTITSALNTDRSIYQGCYFDLYIDDERTVTEASIVSYQLDESDSHRLGLTLDSCGYVTVGRLTEQTELSVMVTVTTTFIDGGPTDGCELAHPIRLKEPLGDRSVVDDATRAVIPNSDSR